MIKIKNKAFTLSEVLITLAVVGTLAALVVPGLIKDYNSKANMTMLQNTVANLTTAVQTQLTKTGVQDIQGTLITENPEQFFRTLDVVNASSDKKYFPDLNSYRTLDGNKAGIPKGCKASAKLKNGVALCMSTFAPPVLAPSGKYIQQPTVYIDLNGTKEPNMVGVDLFGLYISAVTDTTGTRPRHAGDVTGVDVDLKNSSVHPCRKSTEYAPIFCYSYAEQSGFDPNYWKDIK